MKKSAIPNTFTLGNLAFGLLSILMTFHGNFKLAAIFVLLAALADRYDGRIARLLNVDSEIGKELDSLADLVSFGAYRLARYNISTFDGVFTGVPITLAGSFMAVFVLFTVNRPLNPVLPVIFIIALSYLMVSKFQLKKV